MLRALFEAQVADNLAYFEFEAIRNYVSLRWYRCN